MPLSRCTTRAARLFEVLDAFLIQMDYGCVSDYSLRFVMPRMLSFPQQLTKRGGWVKEVCYYLAVPFLLIAAIWDGLMGRPFGDD